MITPAPLPFGNCKATLSLALHFIVADFVRFIALRTACILFVVAFHFSVAVVFIGGRNGGGGLRLSIGPTRRPAGRRRTAARTRGAARDSRHLLKQRRHSAAVARTANTRTYI